MPLEQQMQLTLMKTSFIMYKAKNCNQATREVTGSYVYRCHGVHSMVA